MRISKRLLRSQAYGIAIAIIMLAGMALPAMADPVTVLDQAFGPVDLSSPRFFFGGAGHFFANISSDLTWAQTFTSGVSGTLDSVSLFLSRASSTPSPLIVDIQQSPTADTSTALGSVAVAPSAIPVSAPNTPGGGSFVNVNFSSFQIPTTPGEHLAIVLSTASPFPAYQLEGVAADLIDPYPGGALLAHRSDQPPDFFFGPAPAAEADAYFRTFVTTTEVPEPGTFVLVGLGLATMVGLKWRKAL